jgi:mRNA interferase MazF
VVIAQGDIWWAELGDPVGAQPGYRRPVVILQGNAFNQSRIATVVCVPLTTNLKWAEAPGNVLLRRTVAGLKQDSVANVSQIMVLDKTQLEERIGAVLPRQFEAILAGVDVVLGR